MLPLARQQALIVEQLPDETHVYDRTTHKTHRLDRASALLWMHCDGRTPIIDLARILAREFQLERTEADVRLTLRHLEDRGLLEAGVRPSTLMERLHRREAVRRLELATEA